MLLKSTRPASFPNPQFEIFRISILDSWPSKLSLSRDIPLSRIRLSLTSNSLIAVNFSTFVNYSTPSLVMSLSAITRDSIDSLFWSPEAMSFSPSSPIILFLRLRRERVLFRISTYFKWPEPCTPNLFRLIPLIESMFSSTIELLISIALNNISNP